MSNVIEDIKRNFNTGNALTKLIYINVGVFLLFQILFVFSFLFSIAELRFSSFFALPADITALAKKPWTIMSYMFLHNSFLHLLFNMVFLYLGGKLFLQFLHPRQLLSTYILGGISGGLLFILAYNYIPALKHQTIDVSILGASASILSIMVAIATYSPNYQIFLNFNRLKRLRWIFAIVAFFLQAFLQAFGNGVGFFGTLNPLMVGLIFFYIGTLERSPKIKYIILILIILDFISIPIGNPGGHIAHLGGAFFGFLYVKQLNGGNDLASGFNKIMHYFVSLLKHKRKLRKVYNKTKSDQDFRKEKLIEQAKIDKILEKIAKSGYEGLTKQEKDILFKASKK